MLHICIILNNHFIMCSCAPYNISLVFILVVFNVLWFFYSFKKNSILCLLKISDEVVAQLRFSEYFWRSLCYSILRPLSTRVQIVILNYLGRGAVLDVTFKYGSWELHVISIYLLLIFLGEKLKPNSFFQLSVKVVLNCDRVWDWL